MKTAQSKRAERLIQIVTGAHTGNKNENEALPVKDNEPPEFG